MSDLAEFLLARIEEDEAVARATILQIYGQRGEWVAFDNKEHLSQTTVFAWQNGDKLGQVCDTEMSWIGHPARDHIARWDPARVLAECEAKRRIVVKYRETLAAQEAKTDEHTRASSRIDRHGELPLLRRDGWVYEGRLWGLKVALTFLALPYADHPDYRQEWRP